jgi:hypothetical protein
MRFKILDFKRVNKYEAHIILDLLDHKDNSIAKWTGRYIVEDGEYWFADFFDKEVFIKSLIDWKDVSDELEQKITLFDYENGIKIQEVVNQI